MSHAMNCPAHPQHAASQADPMLCKCSHNPMSLIDRYLYCEERIEKIRCEMDLIWRQMSEEEKTKINITIKGPHRA